MQNALRAKLAELQNTRRIKEEKKEQQQKEEERPQKLDFSLFDDSDFVNRSWVDIIDEEEQQQRKRRTPHSANAAAAAPPPAAAPAASSSAAGNKRRNSERAEADEAPQTAETEHPQKFDFSFFDDSDFVNRSWVDIIDEEEQRARKKREEALAASPSVVSSSAPNKRRRILPSPREGWVEPNNGWCMDEATLERRDKDLQKMKEKPTYKRYLSQIPKFARKKGVHPRTPNKYINHTRRSWDKQVRLWKLAIYEWAGETPSSSVCGSRCPSECSESGGDESPVPVQKKARTLSIGSGGGSNNNNEADNVASIMGHFDLNTLRGAGDETTLGACGFVGGAFAVGDESTLKPPTTAPTAATAAPAATGTDGAAADVSSPTKTMRGPTDFSDLVVPKKETTNDDNDGWMEVKKRPKLEAKKRVRTTNVNRKN